MEKRTFKQQIQESKDRCNIRMKITAKYFKDKVGREPENDDLERSNCKDAGKRGHKYCGWCKQCSKPKYMCYCKQLYI